jgi:hypothetical protein
MINRRLNNMLHRLSTRLMPAQARQVMLLSPTPISIHDDGNVLGHR